MASYCSSCGNRIGSRDPIGSYCDTCRGRRNAQAAEEIRRRMWERDAREMLQKKEKSDDQRRD